METMREQTRVGEERLLSYQEVGGRKEEGVQGGGLEREEAVVTAPRQGWRDRVAFRAHEAIEPFKGGFSKGSNGHGSSPLHFAYGSYQYELGYNINSRFPPASMCVSSQLHRPSELKRPVEDWMTSPVKVSLLPTQLGRASEKPSVISQKAPTAKHWHMRTEFRLQAL